MTHKITGTIVVCIMLFILSSSMCWSADSSVEEARCDSDQGICLFDLSSGGFVLTRNTALLTPSAKDSFLLLNCSDGNSSQNEASLTSHELAVDGHLCGELMIWSFDPTDSVTVPVKLSTVCSPPTTSDVVELRHNTFTKSWRTLQFTDIPTCSQGHTKLAITVSCNSTFKLMVAIDNISVRQCLENATLSFETSTGLSLVVIITIGVVGGCLLLVTVVIAVVCVRLRKNKQPLKKTTENTFADDDMTRRTISRLQSEFHHSPSFHQHSETGVTLSEAIMPNAPSVESSEMVQLRVPSWPIQSKLYPEIYEDQQACQTHEFSRRFSEGRDYNARIPGRCEASRDDYSERYQYGQRQEIPVHVSRPIPRFQADIGKRPYVFNKDLVEVSTPFTHSHALDQRLEPDVVLIYSGQRQA